MRSGNFLTLVVSATMVFGIQVGTLFAGAHTASAAVIEDNAFRTTATNSPSPAHRAAAASPARTDARSYAIMLAQAHGHRVSNGPQIFLFKGLADIFSAGMDTLAAKLAARGVVARVANHSTSDSLADAVIQRYRAGGRGPIVIIGHSLGADAAVEMAQRLNEARVPVALVVGFGATRSFDIPPNVGRAVNYYQGYKAWRGPRVANFNMDNAAGVNHFNIEKIDRLQNETVSRVIAAIGGGRRSATQSQAIAPRM